MDGGIVVGIVVALFATWAILVAILWLLRPRDVALRELVGVIPDVLRLIRDLIKDPATPFGVKVALVGLLAWLISPLDLVPEFIPVLGPLDDVIVAVLVMRYVRRRVGIEELRRHWRGSEPGFELLRRIIGTG